MRKSSYESPKLEEFKFFSQQVLDIFPWSARFQVEAKGIRLGIRNFRFNLKPYWNHGKISKIAKKKTLNSSNFRRAFRILRHQEKALDLNFQELSTENCEKILLVLKIQMNSKNTENGHLSKEVTAVHPALISNRGYGQIFFLSVVSWTRNQKLS